MEHELPACCSGVYALSEGTKADAAFFEFAYNLNQVLQAAAKTIQPPHDNDIVLAEMIEQARKLGSLTERTAGFLLEDPRAPHLAKRV